MCYDAFHDDARFSILTQQNFGSNCFHVSQKFVDQHRKIACRSHSTASHTVCSVRSVYVFPNFYWCLLPVFLLLSSFFSFFFVSLLHSVSLFLFSTVSICVYTFFFRSLSSSHRRRRLCGAFESHGVCVNVLCIFVVASTLTYHHRCCIMVVDRMHIRVLCME